MEDIHVYNLHSVCYSLLPVPVRKEHATSEGANSLLKRVSSQTLWKERDYPCQPVPSPCFKLYHVLYFAMINLRANSNFFSFYIHNIIIVVHGNSDFSYHSGLMRRLI